LGCADPIFPSVYARVSAGWDWIQDTVCDMSEYAPREFECDPPTLEMILLTERMGQAIQSGQLMGPAITMSLVAAMFGLTLWAWKRNHTTMRNTLSDVGEQKLRIDYGAIKQSTTLTII